MDVKDLELLRKIINQLNSLENNPHENVDSFYRSTNYNFIPNLIEYNYEYPDELYNLLGTFWDDESFHKELKIVTTVIAFKENESHQSPNGAISEYIYEF